MRCPSEIEMTELLQPPNRTQGVYPLGSEEIVPHVAAHFSISEELVTSHRLLDKNFRFRPEYVIQVPILLRIIQQIPHSTQGLPPFGCHGSPQIHRQRHPEQRRKSL